MSAFAWQTGYGLFTGSASQVETVRRDNHRDRLFAEEDKAVLRAHGIPFKEEDLWE